MKKSLATAALTATAALFVIPAHAEQIYWTQWDTFAYGSPGSASGVMHLPGGDVTVTYAGEIVNRSDPGDWSQYPGTYTSAAVDNAPTPSNVSIQLVGGDAAILNTITFSTSVVNPVMAIQSLGQPNVLAVYDFGNIGFNLLSQGSGHWNLPCNNCLTQVGNALHGYEGNGTIQFMGTFSSLSWTVAPGEDYHMFTIGAPVPEPEAWALLLAGLGIVGGIARRRRER